MLAVNVLVVADAPHDDDTAIAALLRALGAGQPLAGGVGEHAGDPADELGRDVVIGAAHAVLHLLRAVVREHAVDVFLPAAGVLLHELPVDHVLVLLEQDVGDGVQEADVAVQDRDVDGVLGVDVLVAHHRAGAARVDDHGRNVFLLLMVGGAPEDDRVRFAGVVPEMHDHVAQLDVLVGQRRRIRAQGREIAGDRRGHAHAGIGLDGVGAQTPFMKRFSRYWPSMVSCPEP